jgi:anti-sigma regulatory factor (Ser/Thr protein kinase)
VRHHWSRYATNATVVSMTSNPDSPTGVDQLPSPTPHLTATPTPPGHTFEMRFSSSPRGARLARRLIAHRLDSWGIAYDTDANEALTLIVAELAANAVRHGHVPGRDFRLRLHIPVGGSSVRIEVTDTRAERLPRRPTAQAAAEVEVEETGRGLFLVSHLATSWDWHPRPDGPGKTVWAEYVLPGEDTRTRPVG